MNIQRWVESKGKEVVEKELQEHITPIVGDIVIVTIDDLCEEDIITVFGFEDGSYLSSNLYIDDIDGEFDTNQLLRMISEEIWNNYVEMPDCGYNPHQRNFIEKINR